MAPGVLALEWQSTSIQHLLTSKQLPCSSPLYNAHLTRHSSRSWLQRASAPLKVRSEEVVRRKGRLRGGGGGGGERNGGGLRQGLQLQEGRARRKCEREEDTLWVVGHSLDRTKSPEHRNSRSAAWCLVAAACVQPLTGRPPSSPPRPPELHQHHAGTVGVEAVGLVLAPQQGGHHCAQPRAGVAQVRRIRGQHVLQGQLVAWVGVAWV